MLPRLLPTPPLQLRLLLLLLMPLLDGKRDEEDGRPTDDVDVEAEEEEEEVIPENFGANADDEDDGLTLDLLAVG